MLELQSVSKTFGALPAVDDVSLTVNAGETLALLGPSGCGKSTLLSLIAGLEAPDTGSIAWAGQSLADVPTHRRHFGLMFQDYALFPHKSVAENVGFGLKMEGQSKKAIRERVHWALELVGLQNFEARDVNTLSGGESQRVALARALAPRPRLLMLDEPLGALDRALRERLLDDLRGILQTLQQTTIYVTHDQEEVFALADRIAIMRAGRLIQLDLPQTLYARPASAFVARFLGMNNLLPVLGVQGNVVKTVCGEFQISELSVIGYQLATSRQQSAIGNQQLLLRPTAARFTGSVNPLPVRVLAHAFRGASVRLLVQTSDGTELNFDFLPGNLPAVGERVTMWLEAEGMVMLPEEPGG